MKRLWILLLLVGCATNPDYTPDPCKAQGGVWYKGPMDSQYYCYDEETVRQIVRNMTRNVRT